MPFTVSRDGGVESPAFEAYARLLSRWGIDVAHTPRVPDPETQGRWLPVWPDAVDAERFAEELRAGSHDRAWRAVPLNGATVSEGALGPVTILLSPRSDGCAYGLDLFSRTLIHKRFPGARLPHGLYLYGETKPDVRTTQGHLWDHVAGVLTGLSGEQLAELGGYRLFDQVHHRFLLQPSLVA